MGPGPWALALALAPRRPEADLLGVRGRSPRFREAEGRLMANVPQFTKTFSKKSVKNLGMSTFGVKTKVVRTEILYNSVQEINSGANYNAVSRTSKFWVQGGDRHLQPP